MGMISETSLEEYTNEKEVEEVEEVNANCEKCGGDKEECCKEEEEEEENK